jgi:hypothetical protein
MALAVPKGDGMSSFNNHSALRIHAVYHYYLAVIKAFNLDYRGDAYLVLLEAIDRLHKQPMVQHYAKTVPITQSSGTGKSKTVDKVATERILFPLCLREDLGKSYYGA